MNTGTSKPDTLRDIRSFYLKVWIAAQRLVAFLLFAAFHRLLSLVTAYVIPAGFAEGLKFAQAVIGVMFILIYLYLAWDMLSVFLPSRRPFTGSELTESQKGHAH